MLFIINNLGKFLSISFIFLSTITIAQKKKITCTINYYKPYCGGARPTPEMEKDGQTPKPYSKTTVIFVSQNGHVDSAKTDANGGITLKLKAGTYKFYEAWRFYKKTPDSTDTIRFESPCLKEEWAKEFQVLTLTKKSSNIEQKNTIIEFCDYQIPCFIHNFKPPKRQ